MNLNLEAKILNGLERIAEVLKSLLWEKAKLYAISPLQIQILLFVANHRTAMCNVSYLAKEFNVTKATISDAVRVLVKKGYLEKDYSPEDNRRYNLLIREEGLALIQDLTEYSFPIQNELTAFSEEDLIAVFDTLSKLIYQLNQQGVIQVQRSCFTCSNYRGNKDDVHYCTLLEKELKSQEIRLDCNEYEELPTQ